MVDDTARELVDALYAATPVPKGCRVNHARGLLVEGVFRPHHEASQLSGAAILAGAEWPALVRVSSSSGNADMAEDDPGANPRGLAVRIGNPGTLVLVGHSIEAFPAKDGASFHHFLEIAGASAERPELMEEYLASHGAARGFQAMRSDAPPPSFAGLTYYMLHPYRLSGGEKEGAVGRLSVAGIPDGGARTVVTIGPDYLDAELRGRLEADPVELVLRFQRAPEGVDVTDVSRAWPDAEAVLELGRITLFRIADDQQFQARLTFDPGLLPPGISFAGDPMIETRLAAYQLAFGRRLDT